jgi:hypothetical protein
MPRYFFDLRDHEVAPDAEGVELADDEAARSEAVAFLGRHLVDHPDFGWRGQEVRVHVAREDRTPMFLVMVMGVDLPRGGAPAE